MKIMSKYLNEAYTLRIPSELKAKVQESAKEHNRSMNADIVARLEKSFEPQINPTETFEFESIKRAYIEQANEVRLLREMLEKVLKENHR